MPGRAASTPWSGRNRTAPLTGWCSNYPQLNLLLELLHQTFWDLVAFPARSSISLQVDHVLDQSCEAKFFLERLRMLLSHPAGQTGDGTCPLHWAWRYGKQLFSLPLHWGYRLGAAAAAAQATGLAVKAPDPSTSLHENTDFFSTCQACTVHRLPYPGTKWFGKAPAIWPTAYCYWLGAAATPAGLNEKSCPWFFCHAGSGWLAQSSCAPVLEQSFVPVCLSFSPHRQQLAIWFSQCSFRRSNGPLNWRP